MRAPIRPTHTDAVKNARREDLAITRSSNRGAARAGVSRFQNKTLPVD